jgi:hypothetical protein
MSNHVIDRRTLLAAGISALPLSICGCGGEGDPPASGPQNPTVNGRISVAAIGCYRPQYAGIQAGNLGCGLVNSFGSPILDNPWPQELQIQAQFFSPVQANVFVFDECSVANANALASGEGYILFGRYMANQLLQRTGSSLPIAGVLAHEWGHRAQFTFGWMVQTEATVRRTELEADMWAGLYMGLVKLWTGPHLQSFFQTLVGSGDYNFHSPGHHGTPAQRNAAGATGLTLALQLLQSGQRLNYPQVHSLFVNEVTRITATIQGVESEQLLSKRLSAANEALSPAVSEIGRRFDTEWIRGIALGERQLDELKSMPQVPFDQRINLGPY